jgi:thiol-disulfide isomerase/thioredoxin
MAWPARRQALQRLALLTAGVWPAARAYAQQPPAGEARAGPVPAVGTLLELPVVPMLDGGSFAPAQAQGRVLVLYWWASWCPFCAVQSPLMEKLWQAQRGRGLLMLGLSIDKTMADAQAYRAKHGYTFPSGWVSPAVAQALPKPKGLPVTYVRGRDGRLLMAEAGQLFPEDIEQIARYV